MEEYKVMPDVDQVNAKHDIKLKSAKDLDPSHFNWLLDEFERSRHLQPQERYSGKEDIAAKERNHFDSNENIKAYLEAEKTGSSSDSNYKITLFNQIFGWNCRV